MSYEFWNQRLSESFFTPSRAGKRVYLHVTPEKLVSIAGDAKGFHEFIEAIKSGPFLVEGFCERALAAKRIWRDRKNSFPPYLAYLSFFSLAADHEGDWPAHAYYPRLWHLLGLPQADKPRGFDKMRELWHDLEAWTISDMDGSLGIFNAQTAGRRVNVGLPIAQTILTEDERRRLPELFEAADLEPGAILSPSALAGALARYSARLRRRTQLLLGKTNDSDYRNELMDVLQTELQNWDGEICSNDDQQVVVSRRAGLRLWLQTIDPAGFIKARLVAKLPDAYDASHLLLECVKLPAREFECPPRTGSFTGAIKDASDGREISAAEIAWDSKTPFVCKLTGIRLLLPDLGYRIFVNALKSLQLTGFIESKILPQSDEFYLAAIGTHAVFFATWGPDHCRGWREINVRSGLPTGWRLFKADSILTPGSAEGKYPIFSARIKPAIRLEGGIRAGSSARYFPFALPDIVVESGTPLDSLLFNGEPLPLEPTGRYHLEPAIVGSVNVIESISEGQNAREVLYILSDGWTWKDGHDCSPTDDFGRPSTAEGVQIRGAEIKGGEVPPFVSDPLITVPDLAVLIGAVPGQIADLRRGQPLPGWSPIWAVSVKRHEVTYVFCGQSIEDSRPQPFPIGVSTKKWKSFLWNNRKRTRSMRTHRLNRLLREYQQAAHDL